MTRTTFLAPRLAIIIGAFGLMTLATAPLAGCAYDYVQHTDRVTISGGNAVKANLEIETTNPSKRSMYALGGLGKNGAVTPGTTGTAATSGNPG